MSRKLPGSAIVSGSITLTQITGSLNDTSNAAYAQANSARDQANTARSDANTTFATINTTFATLNTSAGTQNTNIGLAYDQANSARGQANTAYGQANAAYGQANAAYGAANTRLSASGGTLSGDLIITGNLTVSGNSTTLNTEILTVEDADVVLLSNVTSTPALNAGIIVNRGTSTNTFIRWAENIDEWGWSDNGTTTYFFEDLRQGLITTNTTFGTVNTNITNTNSNAINAYAQANAAYGAANNRVLKAGDTMTGQLNVSSGGLIVTGGNVGIGTISQSYKLHIRLPTTTSDILQRWESPSYDSVDLYVGSTQAYFGTVSTTPLAFRTNNTERMRIDGSGNVSIGTTDTGFGGLLVTQTGMSSNLAGVQIYRDTGNYGAMQMNGTNGGYIDFSTPGVDYLGRIIYFTSGNTMQFVTNTAVRMVIDGNGHVAIGTTTAANRLHVRGELVYIDKSGSTEPTVRYRSANDGYVSEWALGHRSSSNDFALKWFDGASWAERVAFTTGGSVAIGTTSPQATFDVRGNIFAGNNGADGFIKLRGYNNANASISTNSGVSSNYNGLALNSNENNNNSLSNWIVDIGGIDNIGRSGTGDTFNIARKPSGGSISTLFLINSSGNVGIGTTNPGFKLDVNGGIGLSSQSPIAFYSNGNTGTFTQTIIYANQNNTSGSITNGIFIERGRLTDSSSGEIRSFVIGSRGGETQFILNGSGNVGIGRTDPQAKLHVQTDDPTFIQITDSGNIATRVGANGSALTFGVDSSNGTTERVRIDNSGNVGINVTNPGEKLQINDGRIFINGEGCGLIVDAGGSKRIGFFKYSGHEAYISRVSGQDFGIVRLGTSDITSVTGLTTDMYFASGGAIGVNYTNPAGYGQLTVNWDVTDSANNNTVGLAIRPAADTTDAYFALFFNSTGSGIGSIRRVGTTNAVAFNTTSDRRLKENITVANSASTLIDSIQVVQYDWKNGPHIKYGVIAQDLYDIIPEAVSVGDPEEDGNFRNPWGVDYSKLVPMLIKEIQELRARVNALENP